MAPLSNEVENLIEKINTPYKSKHADGKSKHSWDANFESFRSINQVNPKSYLGKVFARKNTKGKSHQRHGNPSDSSSSDLSEYSDSDSDFSDTDPDTDYDTSDSLSDDTSDSSNDSEDGSSSNGDESLSSGADTVM